VVDATGATVDNEAELVAASARFSCPLASSYLAVSVQDLMAADSALARSDSGSARGNTGAIFVSPSRKGRPTPAIDHVVPALPQGG